MNSPTPPPTEPDEEVLCPICRRALERLAFSLWDCAACNKIWTASELVEAMPETGGELREQKKP